MLKSLISAFLMYSRIPMPKVEWSEKNRRFSLCFFPLVGGVIGVFFLIWQLICDRIGIGLLLRGAVAAAIPILITGGIHLDGFCDVSDAMASWGDKTRRLEIMKDSHIGAFAVIRVVLYFALEIAVYSESDDKAAAIIAVGFVLSRCLSGIAAVKKGRLALRFCQSCSSDDNEDFAGNICILLHGCNAVHFADRIVSDSCGIRIFRLLSAFFL